MSSDLTFDIVIAHRGPELGLWATISSCEMALQRLSHYDYRYFIVGNGLEVVGQERDALNETLKFLTRQGRLGAVLDLEQPLSPPQARNAGAKIGSAPVIFFLDNHCLVENNYFTRAMTALGDGKDVIHSATKYWAGAPTGYHYRFTLERNFWGYQVETPVLSDRSYRIAAGGHGGFAIRRSLWEEVGGYWDGFVGYGGEEMYFELKLALLDKHNFIDPNMIHWHHPGTRPYTRDESSDFVVNMLMCANIIGGDRWFDRVANSFRIKETKKDNTWAKFDIDVMALEAKAKSHEHAQWMEANRKRSLNEQLVKFSKEGVAL